MVTTNSPNDKLNFTVAQLRHSSLDGDQEVLEIANKTIEEIVKKIRPILKYVDKDIYGVKGVTVAQDGDRRCLVLGRDGSWYNHESGQKPKKWERGWHFFVFSDIIVGLKKVFEEAQEKRERHLAAVNIRKKLLSDINALLHEDQSK